MPEWSFLEGVTVNVAVAHTLANAQKVVDMIRSGKANYHFVEVMTCPGGCIGGGGQPGMTTNEIRKARMAAIYKEDEGKKLRKSHENEQIKQIYAEFLGAPLGEKSHHFCTLITKNEAGYKKSEKVKSKKWNYKPSAYRRGFLFLWWYLLLYADML